MQPRCQKLLADMQKYGQIALEIAGHRTFEQYRQNIEFRLAVERCLSNIGEALTKLRNTDRPMAEQVKDWQQIIRFRNILVHGYGIVDVEETWAILMEEVPELVANVGKLLTEPTEI